MCGSAAHQLVFESLLAKHEDFDFSTKRAIFETFRKLHPILKEQHFLNPKEEEDDPYESTQVTALIANASGIFGVYSIREVFDTRSSGSRHRPRVSLGAMHSQYQRMRNARRWRPPESTPERCSTKNRAAMDALHAPLK